MEKNQNAAVRLYDSYVEDLISREDYKMMKEKYVIRVKEIEVAIKSLENEKAAIENNSNDTFSWMQRLLEYREIDTLSHEVVATLIDRVEVFEDKRVQITFSFKNQLDELVNYMNGIRKEAI